ncbi:MAG: outer membrane beta-barrel protein [Gammaproteobacteria bacterium]
MKRTFIAAAVLLIAAPLGSNAAAPNYNYLYAGYSKGNVEDTSGGKGYTFGGSYEFYPNWFFALDYGRNNYDGGFQTGGFFTKNYLLTIGAHMPITESMDLVARFGAANDKWNQGPSTNLFPGFTVATENTKSGIELDVGIRDMVLDQWEINAFLGHNNAGLVSHDHDSSEFTATVGSVYNFTDQFALGVSYTRSSEESASNFMLTGRWYFQKTLF